MWWLLQTCMPSALLPLRPAVGTLGLPLAARSPSTMHTSLTCSFVLHDLVDHRHAYNCSVQGQVLCITGQARHSQRIPSACCHPGNLSGYPLGLRQAPVLYVLVQPQPQPAAKVDALCLFVESSGPPFVLLPGVFWQPCAGHNLAGPVQPRPQISLQQQEGRQRVLGGRVAKTSRRAGVCRDGQQGRVPPRWTSLQEHHTAQDRKSVV